MSQSQDHQQIDGLEFFGLSNDSLTLHGLATALVSLNIQFLEEKTKREDLQEHLFTLRDSITKNIKPLIIDLEIQFDQINNDTGDLFSNLKKVQNDFKILSDQTIILAEQVNILSKENDIIFNELDINNAKIISIEDNQGIIVKKLNNSVAISSSSSLSSTSAATAPKSLSSGATSTSATIAPSTKPLISSISSTPATTTPHKLSHAELPPNQSSISHPVSQTTTTAPATYTDTTTTPVIDTTVTTTPAKKVYIPKSMRTPGPPGSNGSDSNIQTQQAQSQIDQNLPQNEHLQTPVKPSNTSTPSTLCLSSPSQTLLLDSAAKNMLKRSILSSVGQRSNLTVSNIGNNPHDLVQKNDRPGRRFYTRAQLLAYKPVQTDTIVFLQQQDIIPEGFMTKDIHPITAKQFSKNKISHEKKNDNQNIDPESNISPTLPEDNDNNIEDIQCKNYINSLPSHYSINFDKKPLPLLISHFPRYLSLEFTENRGTWENTPRSVLNQTIKTGNVIQNNNHPNYNHNLRQGTSNFSQNQQSTSNFSQNQSNQSNFTGQNQYQSQSQSRDQSDFNGSGGIGGGGSGGSSKWDKASPYEQEFLEFQRWKQSQQQHQYNQQQFQPLHHQQHYENQKFDINNGNMGNINPGRIQNQQLYGQTGGFNNYFENNNQNNQRQNDPYGPPSSSQSNRPGGQYGHSNGGQYGQNGQYSQNTSRYSQNDDTFSDFRSESRRPVPPSSSSSSSSSFTTYGSNQQQYDRYGRPIQMNKIEQSYGYFDKMNKDANELQKKIEKLQNLPEEEKNEKNYTNVEKNDDDSHNNGNDGDVDDEKQRYNKEQSRILELQQIWLENDALPTIQSKLNKITIQKVEQFSEEIVQILCTNDPGGIKCGITNERQASSIIHTIINRATKEVSMIRIYAELCFRIINHPLIKDVIFTKEVDLGNVASIFTPNHTVSSSSAPSSSSRLASSTASQSQSGITIPADHNGTTGTTVIGGGGHYGSKSDDKFPLNFRLIMLLYCQFLIENYTNLKRKQLTDRYIKENKINHDGNDGNDDNDGGDENKKTTSSSSAAGPSDATTSRTITISSSTPLIGDRITLTKPSEGRIFCQFLGELYKFSLLPTKACIAGMDCLFSTGDEEDILAVVDFMTSIIPSYLDQHVSKIKYKLSSPRVPFPLPTYLPRLESIKTKREYIIPLQISSGDSTGGGGGGRIGGSSSSPPHQIVQYKIQVSLRTKFLIMDFLELYQQSVLTSSSKNTK